MTTTLTPPVTLKISRHIKAPRERVFAAWANAHEFAQWLGGGNRKVISATSDLRPGGEYHIKSTAPDGECGCEIDLTGTYRDVEPPERLSFTWPAGACTPEYKGQLTVVTVVLSEEKGGTLLQLTHEGFPDAEICGKHDHGWNASLDVLEKLV